MQSIDIRVVEVTKRKDMFPKHAMGFDFPEGTKPPLEIGQTYLFEAVHDRHGIRFTKWEKIKSAENSQTKP